MGKNSDRLKDDLYVGEYDFEEEPEIAQPAVTNRAAKKLKQSQQKADKLVKRQERQATRESKVTEKSIENWEPISDKPVVCKCNKCGTEVSAKMLAFFYSPNADLYFPFVEYSCRQCYHVGRRSVFSAALTYDKFEKVYFN